MCEPRRKVIYCNVKKKIMFCRCCCSEPLTNPNIIMLVQKFEDLGPALKKLLQKAVIIHFLICNLIVI